MYARFRGQCMRSNLVRSSRYIRPVVTLSASVVSFMVSASSTSASPSQHNARVRDVLDYIDSHSFYMGGIPMCYEPVPNTPLPEVVRGLCPEDVQENASHMASVVAALLYLACGGLDEAHNLCTPYSWGSPTPYSGRPVRGSPAAQEASYVHALVHRFEGGHVGEFGTGWSNANYWYGATGKHPIHKDLLQKTKELAEGNPPLEKYVANFGPNWDPYKFVSLCAQAASTKDENLLNFCQAVAKAEWKLLFDYCCDRLQKL